VLTMYCGSSLVSLKCVSNVESKLSCGLSDPLTALGHEQAETLGEKWADLRIDQLWASNLERAYVTADVLSKHNKGHPKTRRFDFLNECLDRDDATDEGMHAVRLAIKDHGVDLCERPPVGRDNWTQSDNSLLDGIPHVAFVSHGGFLSHLCEFLYFKEEDSWRCWFYDNTAW
jgi:broad specificity phosphatase PhoE